MFSSDWAGTLLDDCTAESANPKVTIYCLTFNHERYIRRSIESFLMQDTDFDFEIVVHDDASTDSTQKILKEYQIQHPAKIKLILQAENQDSKGLPFIRNYIEPLVAGKYVAICEGDDYWTDPKKLQRQFDALEKHRECSICVHRVEEVTNTGESLGTSFPPFPLRSGVIKSADFIPLNKEYAFQTSSYFIRADEWHSYIKNPPRFKRLCAVGDVPMLLYFGNLGDVYYFDEPMSCYRRGSVNSVSDSLFRQGSVDRISKHAESMIRVYKAYDDFTGGKYSAFCQGQIASYLAQMCFCGKKTLLSLNADDLAILPYLGTAKRVAAIASALFPSIARRLYLLHLSKIGK